MDIAVEVKVIPDDDDKKLTFKCNFCYSPYSCCHTGYLYSRISYMNFIEKNIKCDKLKGHEIEEFDEALALLGVDIEDY